MVGIPAAGPGAPQRSGGEPAALVDLAAERAGHGEIRQVVLLPWGLAHTTRMRRDQRARDTDPAAASFYTWGTEHGAAHTLRRDGGVAAMVMPAPAQFLLKPRPGYRPGRRASLMYQP